MKPKEEQGAGGMVLRLSRVKHPEIVHIGGAAYEAQGCPVSHLKMSLWLPSTPQLSTHLKFSGKPTSSVNASCEWTFGEEIQRKT